MLPRFYNGVLVGLLFLAGCSFYPLSESCDVCGRPLHEQTLYRITLTDGSEVAACCARCGLHFQQGRDDIERSRVADYRSRELMAAADAFFVEDSSLVTCGTTDPVRRDQNGVQYRRDWDRCAPSVVAFKSRAEALLFKREKGGHLKTYPDLLGENP